MIEKINELFESVKTASVQSQQDLEDFRIKFLSKKGLINQLFKDFKSVPTPEKAEVGAALNKLKNAANAKFQESSANSKDKSRGDEVDLTLSISDLRLNPSKLSNN